MTELTVQVADGAKSASRRSARVSPMPMRMPVVKGTRSFASQPQRLKTNLGPLIGRAVMNSPRFA